MASFGKLKNYQRKKFARYKELNDIKTKNDEAYIVVAVKDVKSILSEFSSDDRPTINRDFVELIESKASFVPLETPLVLEIQTASITSSDKILVRRLVKSYFNLKKINAEVKADTLSRKARFLFTIGVLCTCVVPFIGNVSKLSLLTEMLSILASFSVWEFGSLMLFDYDDVKEELVKYNHLSKIRIIYDKE